VATPDSNTAYILFLGYATTLELSVNQCLLCLGCLCSVLIGALGTTRAVYILVKYVFKSREITPCFLSLSCSLILFYGQCHTQPQVFPRHSQTALPLTHPNGGNGLKPQLLYASSNGFELFSSEKMSEVDGSTSARLFSGVTTSWLSELSWAKELQEMKRNVKNIVQITFDM